MFYFYPYSYFHILLFCTSPLILTCFSFIKLYFLHGVCQLWCTFSDSNLLDDLLTFPLLPYDYISPIIYLTLYHIPINNIYNMRSVSIVYKKPRPQPSLHQLPHSQSLAKRSVDQYYTRLAERQHNKQELLREKQANIERTKLRTSNSQRQEDRLNILQTLSIAPMSLRHPPSLQEKDEHRKGPSFLTASRPQELTRPLLLRGLDLPSGTFQDDFSQEKGIQRKLRVLLRCKESKETVVILTANFVSNQHYFWGEQQIEDQAVKAWRLIQSYASIVWVCHREDTMKKLGKFAKGNGLRLDAVYMIVPRRQKTMGFSCNAIQNDFGVRFQRSNTPLVGRQQRRMVALCGVQSNRGQQISWQTLQGRIPTMRNRRSVVHFIRIDMTDHGRLNNAVRVLSQQTLPRPLSIDKIIIDFQQEQKRTNLQPQCGCRIKIQPEPVPLLTRIEEMKSSMTKFFTQSLSLSLTDRFNYDQNENSLQFMIGDALRRNFKIFQQAQTYSEQHAAYVAHRKAHTQIGTVPSLKKATILLTRPSRNLAYFWDI